MATAEETAKAVEQVVECFRDGFHLGDIVKAVRVAAEIAESFTALPGEDRKAFVVDVIRQAYKKANPDIPWVPEPVETWVEDYVLDNLVPSVIELIIDATKGRINVNR